MGNAKKVMIKSGKRARRAGQWEALRASRAAGTTQSQSHTHTHTDTHTKRRRSAARCTVHSHQSRSCAYLIQADEDISVSSIIAQVMSSILSKHTRFKLDSISKIIDLY